MNQIIAGFRENLKFKFQTNVSFLRGEMSKKSYGMVPKCYRYQIFIENVGFNVYLRHVSS